jgi:hypothetical protein
MSAAWETLVLLEALTLAVVIVILVAVMRQVGGLLVKLNPLEYGEIEGGPVIGSIVDLPEVESDTPAVVIFVSPTCSICELLLPGLHAVSADYHAVQLVAAVLGSADGISTDLSKQLDGIATINGERLRDEWRIPGTPFAVGLSRAHRVIAQGVVNSLDQLDGLLVRALREDPVDEPRQEELVEATDGLEDAALKAVGNGRSS